MGPTFIEKVEEVKKLLADADGYYDSARYDLAFKKYEQVLALDPYNTAARRGEEKIDNAKYHYGEDAYNETRGRQLSDVQTGWQQPLRQYGRTASEIFNPVSGNLSDTARISNKLSGIRIEHLSYRNATVAEVIDDIRQRAPGVNIVVRFRRLGEIAPVLATVEGAPAPAATAAPVAGGSPEAGAPATPVPARVGVAPAGVSGSPTSPEQAKITLEVDDIPLLDALTYIANQAALKVKVEPHAVLLIPLTEQSDELVTKTYKVPPEFFGGPLDVGYYLSAGVGGGGQAPSGTGQTIQPAPVATGVIEKNAASFQNATGIGTGAGAASTSQALQTNLTTRQQLVNDRQLVGRADAKVFLQSMGVSFPPNSSATFFPHNGTLVVRNTADNLDMVDALVEQANASGPKQVEIEAKFIEITQTNLKELGFDWLLGPFQLGNHSGVFGSGGTSGSAANPADFPFVNNTGGPVGATQNGQPFGVNPVTAGNRSGTFGISANALDALLAGGTGGMSVAPGVLGLAGVFTNPQFQVVIRALNQKKGIDLLSAPSVTTKSGQRAIIEVIRELRYPSTFTPPQVPSIGTTTTTGSQVVPVVVTPTTPSTWETRNTGVTLEVEPVVGGDATTVDLNLIPQVVEFEGFINYGSPINAVGVNTVGGVSISNSILLTQNTINQPVFSTRKVTTSVSVYDGQTVVLGGLMREDVQKTEDKVPIIGDIPLVGRAFRTNVEQHIKKNLVMFVTARIVTPAGVPLNEEEEEGLLPPALPEVPAYKK